MSLVGQIVLSDELVDKLADSFLKLEIREKHGWTLNQYISGWVRGDLPAHIYMPEDDK